MADGSTVKCSYYSCNKSLKQLPGLRRFHFPTKNEKRCEKWILNSGNAELLKFSPKKLKNRFLCQDHFRKEDFFSKKLVRDAIPIKYTTVQSTCAASSKKYSQILPSSNSETRNEFEIEIVPSTSKQTMSPSTSSVTSSEEFSRQLTSLPIVQSPQRRNLKRKLKDMSETVNSMKAELKKHKLVSSFCNNINLLPPFPRALVTMQLSHKRRSPWLASEKMVALPLYYKSPSTYKFLRSKKVTLPSPSTLSAWLKTFSYRPGINRGLMNCLKMKAETMDRKSKFCVVAFDEMALKQCIEFSKAKGYIEGFEDLGKHGRRPVLAKQALVFLARGLYSSWKIPIAFYLSENGAGADILTSIIKEVLNEMKKTGLEVLAVVSDQASTNQRAYKNLGVVPEKPYFTLDENKYFTIFDAPHIMKNIRNNLLDCDFLWGRTKLVSFDYVREIYAIDKRSETGKALPKLTDNHMNPGPFQKMSVKLATQVLSNSVSAAIKTAVEAGEMSENAQDTAEFISIIDSAFDALNSRNLKEKKKCRRALHSNNIQAFEALKAAKQMMYDLQKLNRQGNLKRVACFDGLIITINAVEMLYNDQKDRGYDFLLTARLNQDIIENLFSIFRQRGGYNRNPSVRMFQAAFKANCVQHLMKAPKSSNTESLGVDNLVSASEVSPTGDATDIGGETSDTSHTSSSELDETNKEASLQTCAVVYFSGYLAKKNFDKFGCNDCRSALHSWEPLIESGDILLFYKNYNIVGPSALKKPTKLQLNFTDICMKEFHKYIIRFSYKKKIYSLLQRKLQSKLNKHLNEWNICAAQCVSHREYMLNLLIRTLLFKFCKEKSANVKTCTRKNQKLKILQNI